MSRLLWRNRKMLTSTFLGFWVFAVFVGIANACAWDGVTVVPHRPTLTVDAVAHAIDDTMAAASEEYCSKDLPLLGAPQRVQDQPTGQPLVVATHHDLGFLPIRAPVLRAAWIDHPSSGVPFSLRIVRLTL